MGLFKQKFNPVSGSFNLVPTGTIITFKDGVTNAAALPSSGNTLNDARITNDTGHLYVWSGTTWVDQGDVINLTWSAIDGKPTSSVANIDDAVSKKHSNSLDHAQGTDQGLDTGGLNASTAAQVKGAVDNSHAPHSDDQVIPDQLSDLSDDATHRLVTDTEKSTWNDITDVALNVMLNAFRIAQIASLTIFNMVKGFVDEYEDESGINLVNSINQLYDNVNDLYTPNFSSGSYDSYTKLLLHLDNDVVDAATGKSVTNNGVTFSSSIKKFGTHAGYFNTYHSLVIPHSSDDIFDANFTIDAWIYVVTRYADGGHIYLKNPGDNSSIIDLYVTPDGRIQFEEYNPGLLYAISSTTGVITNGNWMHIAAVRAGSTITLYVNGVNVASGSYSGIVGNFASDVIIGYRPLVFVGFTGYIDEFRISKGVARWTSDFSGSLPSSPYAPEPPTIYNMDLISNSQTASIIPSEIRTILFEEDVDAITINTDLKVSVSRDGGTTFTQVTLEDEGNYITGARILSGSAIVSSQPSGSNIVYKIETLNNKQLKIHGTAVSYK
jgi:hypothetical protein